jgi:hypothetical protein
MKVELQRPVKRAPSVLAETFFLRTAGGIGKLDFEHSFDHSTQLMRMISDNHKLRRSD